MNNEIGLFDTISADYIVAGVKMELDLTSTTNNLSKSVMVNEGVLFESRKVLEPSTYFPAREGKE
jgi:hypothetical protein